MSTIQKLKIDSDIKDFCSQVEKIRPSEYVQARQDIANEQISLTHREAFESVVVVAERYFKFLKETKLVKPTQFRIGLDRATQAPALVVILPKSEDIHVSDLMDTARAIELYVWENDAIDLNIWTLVDDCLDINRLERDFPYSRKSL